MKKKLLCCALLAGMSMAQSAFAQSYDDRWYLTAGAGVAMFDDDRSVNDDPYYEIGLGKFVTENISIDAALWYSNPTVTNDPIFVGTPERTWQMYSLSIVGRYHFVKEGRDWNPYLAAGLGAQKHRDETLTPASSTRTGAAVTGLLGAGVQADIGRGYLRAEIGVRYDADDEAFGDEDGYLDRYFGASFLFPLGAEATPAPEPTPIPQKTCADLDDDGDGVNNCNDQCPATPAGEAVGPNGCPVPVPEPEPVLEPKPFRG
ncbi:MAG: porin family protein [Arenimonas sp.]